MRQALERSMVRDSQSWRARWMDATQRLSIRREGTITWHEEDAAGS